MNNLPSLLIHTLRGDVDLARARTLRPELDALLADLPEAVLLDLSGVTFLDTAGLSALIGFIDRGRRIGVRVETVAASRPVTRLLALVGSEHHFTLAS